MAIPIYMMGTSGGSSERDPLLSPCINCLVVNPSTGKRLGAWALLDSGAYPNVICQELAAALELEKVGEATLHAALNTVTANIHTGQIAVEGLPGQVDITFQASNHRSNGHPYELILGRQFLTAFDFGFSFGRKEWYLSYPGE